MQKTKGDRMHPIKNKEFPIVHGTKYIPRNYVSKKPPTITAIRRRLSKIKGSLAETIASIREEE